MKNNNLTEELIKELPEGSSLCVYDKNNNIIFQNSGKWLHPLFDLEDFLAKSKLSAENLFLHDKIAGRAAASLIAKMGFKKCFIDLMSKHAIDVFENNNITYGYVDIVDKISCQTEKILDSSMDLETVYKILKERAGK
ncbi:MAG: DUF1893 domain-containing protein [Spirochaetales bacterium]|nr:DUF1893 domain-containing protein [Spirochaetales bacterium]